MQQSAESPRSKPHPGEMLCAYWSCGQHATPQSIPWEVGLGTLDGCADQISPLSPGAVVVPHLGHPQKVFQHEPGVAGALADAAISHGLFIQGHPLAFIEGPQLICRDRKSVV